MDTTLKKGMRRFARRYGKLILTLFGLPWELLFKRNGSMLIKMFSEKKLTWRLEGCSTSLPAVILEHLCGLGGWAWNGFSGYVAIRGRYGSDTWWGIRFFFLMLFKKAWQKKNIAAANFNEALEMLTMFARVFTRAGERVARGSDALCGAGTLSDVCRSPRDDQVHKPGVWRPWRR